MNIAHLYRGVRHVRRRVEALAVIEDMRAVEVVQTERLGNGVEVIVDFALDAVRDVVDEADEWVVAVRGSGV